MNVRKYMIELFVLALFVSVVVWVDMYFVLLNERAWYGYENDVGNWVGVQLIIYAVFTLFVITIGSWVLRDRQTVKYLTDDYGRLRNELRETEEKLKTLEEKVKAR